jgi:flavin-binding protein dodecin
MSDRVYKLIEVTGTSITTMEEAVQNAVARASQTIRNMRWFEVIETRGAIADDQVSQWQVTVKIGFALEEDEQSLSE